MSLGLCMIVKNEEEHLPRCLDSIKGIVDEMVVVDTGSTDRTVAIAHDFGARVHTFNWCNDFAVARNAALEFVKSDWVLVLDADETLTAAIVPHLKAAIQQPDALVINLLRQEVGAQQSPYSLMSRLFRRHPQIRWSRPYHALIDDSVLALQAKEPHWQVCTLESVAIVHYGYAPGVIAAQGKHEKARQAMEQFLAQHPHDAYVCSKLGALYVEMGDVVQGIQLLERGCQAMPQDPATRYELHYHLGCAYSRQGQSNLASQQFEAALQVDLAPVLKVGAGNNLAGLYQQQGQLQAAQVLYEQLIECCPEFAIAHYNLGLARKAAGDLEGAIAAYRSAIAVQPDYADAHQNLGVALLKQGQFAASVVAFQQAFKLHQGHNPQAAEHLRQGLAPMGIDLSR